jgi:glutathione S-transferase
MQWLFFEQCSHEPHIAVAHFWLVHGEPSEKQRRRRPDRHASGYAALDAAEAHLAEGSFFVADEGGFDVAPYDHVRAWLERVASEPGHIPITQG